MSNAAATSLHHRQQNPTMELTSRQREVLELLVFGLTLKEAGKALQISPRTIRFHKYRIMANFGLKTNFDLIRFAIRKHIIPAA